MTSCNLVLHVSWFYNIVYIPTTYHHHTTAYIHVHPIFIVVCTHIWSQLWSVSLVMSPHTILSCLYCLITGVYPSSLLQHIAARLYTCTFHYSEMQFKKNLQREVSWYFDKLKLSWFLFPARQQGLGHGLCLVSQALQNLCNTAPTQKPFT